MIAKDDPVICIGCEDDPRQDWGWMAFCEGEFFEKYEPYVQRILDGNRLVFNVARYPERGDAIHRLHEGSAVFCFHLFWDNIRTSEYSMEYYNQFNHLLIPTARELGIPLFTVGDYPFRPIPVEHSSFWNRY